VYTPTDARTRRHIVRLREQGHSYEKIAEMAGVGRATVNRVLRLHRETGDIAPRQAGGGNVSPIRGAVADELCAIVVETSDATVDEITALLVERSQVATSRSAVFRAMSRMGFSRKKSPSSPPSATPGNIASSTASSAKSSR
jgi:transposase